MFEQEQKVVYGISKNTIYEMEIFPKNFPKTQDILPVLLIYLLKSKLQRQTDQ